MLKPIEIQGHIIKGHVHNRIEVLTNLGKEAESREENPHPFWQQAEYYRKTIKSRGNND